MPNLRPFNERNSLGGFGDFYNMLDDFFNNPLSTENNLKGSTFKLDIEDKNNEYVVKADLPGVKKDEISLRLDRGRLTISIERNEEDEKEEKNYIHKERRYSSMSRSIQLENVKEEDIKAKLNDGVLSINIPKKEEDDNSKKIPIE